MFRFALAFCAGAAAVHALPALWPGAAVAPRLSKDARTEMPQEDRSVGVFAGLSAAAVLLGCAFWIILKGGQHEAN